MASPQDHVSMALFCDFENVALGVRDAKYDKFDIKRVLERLLLKGSIVVKKAYCDWERYKGFKAAMHEANFELIEIPHVRQSGKNSADIRLVVDALDLCYTKAHVNTFVIISGDSDFSPLVSKLRENAKQVIGVGVKQSTSDLLIANCDEFIFYDDLVRETPAAAKRETREAQPAARRAPEEEKRRKDELDARKSQAIEFAVETFEALLAERGDSGKIWASVLKEAIKRRKPGFNETYYGFRAFGNLLEEAQARGLLEFGRDEKSGAYVYRSNAGPTPATAPIEPAQRDTASAAGTHIEMQAETQTAAETATPAGYAAEPASAGEGGAAAGERRSSRRPRQGEARAAKKSAKQAAELNAEAPVQQPGGRSEQSGGRSGRRKPEAAAAQPAAAAAPVITEAAAPAAAPAPKPAPRPAARATPKPAAARSAAAKPDAAEPAAPKAASKRASAEDVPAAEAAPAKSGGRRRGQRKPAAQEGAEAVPAPVTVAKAAPGPTAKPVANAAPADEAAAKPARKPATRSRRPRKQETPPDAA